MFKYSVCQGFSLSYDRYIDYNKFAKKVETLCNQHIVFGFLTDKLFTIKKPSEQKEMMIVKSRFRRSVQ